MKFIYCLMVMLWPYISRPQTIKPLSVGDKVPEMLYPSLINYKDSTVAFSDLKGKVIILDFWATWCSACISHLNEADSLQRALKDKLRYILVSTIDTRDTKEKIEKFFNKRTLEGDTCSLPVIINDTVLNRLFTHRFLPHYVWINTNGIVSAFTGAEACTADNIITLFNENKISLSLKQDVMDYNARQPLLQNGNGGNPDRLLFRSTFTKYLKGLGSGARKNKDGTNKKITFLNTSILSLYQAALGFDANRIIVFTIDSSRYFITNQSDAAWQNHLYCYEYTTPVDEASNIGKLSMLNDLNERLQLRGRMEMRKVQCYVLIKTGETPLPQSTNNNWVQKHVKEPSMVIHNEPLSVLLQQFNSQIPESRHKPIFLDETGFSKNLSLELYATVDNLPLLKKELQAYGFNLITTTRELNMFVVSELNPQLNH